MEGVYEALTGVGALQDAGVYSVTLHAIASDGAASEVGGRIRIESGGFGYENLTVPQNLVPLLDPQVNLDEQEQLATIFSQWSATQYWTGPLQYPAVGRIASYFGTRRSFNGGLLRTYHSGADVIAGIGTPVHASAPGRVAAVTQLKVRGNVVIIDHGRGVFTMYCHLSRTVVKEGQMVDVGDVVAYSGNTGRSEGPHIHWELAVGGITVDPLPWAQQAIP
jgi:murein DD-endopeptidase MepM/ murein hydrolase activator NlpD